MKKIMSWVKGKVTRVAMALSVATVALAGAACAEEAAGGSSASSTVMTSLQTGFQTMANDALSAIGTIVVVALPVAGAIFLARKAIGWFKSIAK